MKNLLLTILIIFVWQIGFAYIKEPDKKRRDRNESVSSDISLRENCTQPTVKFFQKINNVRAILTTGGDVWTENSVGTYMVPRKENIEDEVSALYSGAVWIGGRDPGGNLKMMISGHRSASAFDIFSGPLDIGSGSTDKEICDRWDQSFTVLGSEIDRHIAKFKEGNPLDADSIPAGVKYWPAKGNPFFYEKYEFKLPVDHDLAPFFDQDEDDVYDPLNGDYPIIHIEAPEGKGECPPGVYADEMIFWVYNDAGGPHSKSHATPIQMEVQVESFAWSTNDEINDMTFQRYKLINRAPSDIKDCYFAWWVDPDLGCAFDDYVGCVPPPVNLMYVYNMDGLDGSDGCSCDRGTNTYCDKIPMVGIDYFRGPLAHFKTRVDSVFTNDSSHTFIGLDTVYTPIAVDQDGDTTIELGMTSFIYYVNGEVEDARSDPQTGTQFYNYLRGYWKDGTPITNGGTGYDASGTDTIKYVFPDAPNDPNGWSMYSENMTRGDMRTIQSTGPFVLKPGDVNELIIGVPWVPSIPHPGPGLEELLAADELAQSLFDNCFELQDGPDAPDVNIVELDRQIILVLSNDTLLSNNGFENFHEAGLKIDKEKTDDNEYVFEGYMVFQLANGDVSAQELEDFDKARLVFQCDIKNEYSTLYNWKSITNPSENGSSEKIFIPTKKVVGGNKGLKHVVNILEDQFAQESKTLINHRPYYFLALAYETNNYAEFNPKTGEGQREPFFPGRRNVKIYKAVPRPIEYVKLNINALDGPEIVRLEGIGISNRFVEITEETENQILENNFVKDIVYKKGSGPFKVEVFTPFEVKNKSYRLDLVDDNMSDDELDITAYWKLTDLETQKVYVADTTINESNEQIIFGEGFAVTVAQSSNKFNAEEDDNGIIGSRLIYTDPDGVNWLRMIKDNTGITLSSFGANGPFSWDVSDFVSTGSGQADEKYDPENALSSKMTEAPFAPFILTRYENAGERFYVSPAARDYMGKLRSSTYFINKKWKDVLNNVDIVFTSDKSKWSRCVVVENSYDDLYQPYLGDFEGMLVEPEGKAKNFQLRGGNSVGKEDNDGDGLADADGDGTGMGWFPGYAIDVETGERLNIFFGEASIYGGSETIDTLFRNKKATGRDMMFNPTGDLIVQFPGDVDLGGRLFSWNLAFGGMHTIYVTNTRYDECAELRTAFADGTYKSAKNALRTISWASVVTGNLQDSTAVMLSYADGLISNNAKVELRVNNPYQVPSQDFLKADRNGYGSYTFSFEGNAAEDADKLNKENALDKVNVVPNPYYAYSEYETSQFNKQVKITNLPGRCEVTIYSIDGKFIRQYKKDEIGLDSRLGVDNNQPLRYKQINPALVWDLKNHKGIPVASGVYLIHIVSDDLKTERTIKWFGINREFDPTGL